MKNLLATHVFLPEYSSGTEVLTSKTVNGLQRHGHDTKVVATLKSSPAGRCRDAIEGKVPQLRTYLRIAYLVSVILLPTPFTRLLESFKRRFEKHCQSHSS